MCGTAAEPGLNLGHGDGELCGDARVELDLRRIDAERLDVAAQINLALVNLEAELLLDLLRDLLRRDGAEQLAVEPGLRRDLDGLALERLGRALRLIRLGLDLIGFRGLGVFSSFIACAFASFASFRGRRKLRA